MSINIKGLAVAKEKRQIRELINTPQGAIEVYEPTIEDLVKIVDIQVTKELGMETGVVSFDGVTVIRELFPILTNIELGELSDEELADVIENPSVHLLIAQQVVAQIVAEANKLYAERMKTELMNTESMMTQAELIQSIPTYVMEKAKGEGKLGELNAKLEKASKELEEAIEREEQKKATENDQEI